jgi:hypothetical protein
MSLVLSPALLSLSRWRNRRQEKNRVSSEQKDDYEWDMYIHKTWQIKPNTLFPENSNRLFLEMSHYLLFLR